MLNTTRKAPSKKGRADQLNFIKTNSYGSLKDDRKRMRRQATECEEIFAKVILDEGL